MGFQNDSKYRKHMISLKKRAIQGKTVLKDAIQKSQKRYLNEAEKLDEGEEKNRVLRKLDKVTKGLEILENLSEDDIIEFALTTTKNMMAAATNRRLSKEQQMMARVACRKPLSAHLATVKRLVEAESEQSENEEETEPADNAGMELDRTTMFNQIVKMRKEVKRAKVHLIHKLTRTAKLYQNSKGNEKKKEKSLRRAERIVKKVKHIKEVEADEVSMFALSTRTEDVQKLLQDTKIPMKSQAMATITMQRFVAAVVEDFRKKFPDWKKTVPSLLKKKKKKRKLNVETVSATNKSLKNSVKNVNDNDEENSEEENDKSDMENERNNSDDEEESDVSKSEIEGDNGETYKNNRKGYVSNEEAEEEGDESENESKEEAESDNGETYKNNKKGYVSNEEVEEEGDESEEEAEIESEGEKDELLGSNEESQNDSDTEIPIIKRSPLKSLKRHLELPRSEAVNPKLSKSKVDSNIKSNKVARKNLEVKESGEPLKQSLKPRLVKEKPKVVDPFFMTTTNEEYYTSQVPTGSDDNESKWKDKSDEFKPTKFDKFSKLNSNKHWIGREDNWKRNKFSNQESQYNRKPFVQRTDKPSFNNGSEPFNIFTNRKERRKALQKPPQETKVEKLHPSWEAKKKQTSIASFQGKKITFD